MSDLVFTTRCDHVSSACPSVTLVDTDHIGWKSWKLIARRTSWTPSLFVAQTPSTYSQGNMENFGEITNLLSRALTLVPLCEETWEALIKSGGASCGHRCNSTASYWFRPYNDISSNACCKVSLETMTW